ncbi:MAG: hypothetical protein DMG33_09645 [Acidobacteria bacterium]|nr:MAG: hypothetical protein DMG33_09645 [Acidobacteriota bacterium]
MTVSFALTPKILLWVEKFVYLPGSFCWRARPERARRLAVMRVVDFLAVAKKVGRLTVTKSVDRFTVSEGEEQTYLSMAGTLKSAAKIRT